jgi:hypothetical protein
MIMTGYKHVNLNDLVIELGEDDVKLILSTYSCPYNKDVEWFLRHKAIEFSKQGLSKTHLIFTSYKDELVLIGYFTLATKFFFLKKSSLSNRLRRRISKFARYDNELKRYQITAPLIAQLGKNYTNTYNRLITGDELLKMACDKVKGIQNEIGGKVVYLECEDNERLIDFYRQNGFVNFGKRELDGDELDKSNTKYYIQMLKYLDT